MRLMCVALALSVLLVPGLVADEKPRESKSKKETPKKAEQAETAVEEEEVDDSLQVKEFLAQQKAEQKAAREAASHVQTGEIVIKGKAGNSLQAFCLGADGKIFAVVGKPRGYSGTAEKGSSSEIQVYGADEKKAGGWTVDFHVQSINAGPGGKIVVAGDGQLALYDTVGKLLGKAAAPNLASALEDKKALRKQAEEQLAAVKESYTESMKYFEEDRKELADKDPKSLTKAEKSRLRQLDAQIAIYRQAIEQQDKLTVESMLESVTSRLRIINAVALSDKDVFYTCGETKGYGYALWRISHDFQEPKKLTSGLSGCCGQMDIQCRDGDCFVAENSRHRVVGFDREGKQILTFGNGPSRVAVKSGEVDFSKFGGCCNPMNIRFGTNGEFYTSESEGYVKQFTAEGKFVRLVGFAASAGGCKCVAIAAAPQGDKIYFYEQTGSKLIVLSRPDKKTASR